MSGMSPVAADFTSAESGTTDDPDVVPEPVVADAAGWFAEEVLELEDPDEPQPAAINARSVEVRTIAARTIASILQRRPENVLNAYALPAHQSH